MVHNPYQRFSAAACGDAGALRRLVDDCAATARREGDWSALVEAMLLARLAYGLTMLREDGLRLMELLELAVSGAEMPVRARVRSGALSSQARDIWVTPRKSDVLVFESQRENA